MPLIYCMCIFLCWKLIIQGLT